MVFGVIETMNTSTTAKILNLIGIRIGFTKSLGIIVINVILYYTKLKKPN